MKKSPPKKQPPLFVPPPFVRQIDETRLECPHCHKFVLLDDCDSLGGDDEDCVFCFECGEEFSLDGDWSE